ncbi:hypothetical protein DH2020_016569 [Rehmannia glutinosa]|uniref:Zinc knuckle CX2CX4HX4C domain-containing protein n=1 Tax=Rehmannia glutinosa TaxID=99300 RepID=A0ABR0WS73_REHGL
MQLEGEGEGGLLLDNIDHEGQTQDLQWCLVGRFLLDRLVNFVALKNTLASIWRPVKVMGQVFDLPFGFMTEKVGKCIGDFIGLYVEADKHSFTGIWQNYIRIRVAFDVRNPLKCRMKIKNIGGEWVWIHFKYEKLPTFCFYCGFIGHSDKFCAKLFNIPSVSEDRAYGAWLRVPSRRQQGQSGGQWLHSSFPMHNYDQNHEEDGGFSPDNKSDNCAPQNQGYDYYSEVSYANRGGVTGGSYDKVELSVILGKDLTVFDSGNRININLGAGKEKEVVISDNKRHRTEKKENSINLIIDKDTDFADSDLAFGPDIVSTSGRLTGFYGFLERSRRRNLSAHSNLPWCCLGDFNDLLSLSEKRGGSVHPDRLIVRFRSSIDDCSLIDLGMFRYPFTWERGRGSVNWVKERLDRCFATQNWCSLFPNCKVWNMEASMSDHSPIYVDTGQRYRIKRVRRFRFENAWSREKDCCDVVEMGWNRGLTHVEPSYSNREN